jgi:hypothetical protein
MSSICSSDFGLSLTSIGANIVESMRSIDLYCHPSAGKVTIIDDQKFSQIISVTDLNSKILRLVVPLQSGHAVRVQYQCESLN